MFTATCRFATIARLEDDPDLVSVAVSPTLRVIGDQGAVVKMAGKEEPESGPNVKAESPAEREEDSRQDE